MIMNMINITIEEWSRFWFLEPSNSNTKYSRNHWLLYTPTFPPVVVNAPTVFELNVAFKAPLVTTIEFYIKRENQVDVTLKNVYCSSRI
jgi:hypothetical protein